MPGQDRLPLSLPIETELKGRYVVGRVLGEPGGFGVTYLSYDRLQEKRVAIKEYMPREVAGRDTDGVSVVPHSGKGSDEFEYGKEQFLGEAKTLVRFDHANIVSVRDFFEDNGTAYLVMEYYEGKPLDQYLAEQPESRMDPEVATEILLRVLDGLKELHAEGYLHRDVKPENIYLTAEGRPILIDFGAARQAMGERSRSLSVVMTEGYAPYEQYSRQGNQGPHTDVYACGATLYRMITGQKPPPATDRVMEDRLKEPRSLNPEVPHGLSQVIVEALAMGDEERIPTVEAFQDQLRAGLRGEIAPPPYQEREPTSGEQSADVSSERASVETSNSSRGDPSRRSSPASGPTQPRKENVEDGKTGWSTVAIGALIVMVLGLGGVAVVLYPSSEEKVAQTTERQTTEQSGTEESGSKAGSPSSGDEERAEAGQFLKAARGHLEAGRLMKPEGANALAAVRQALNRDPGSEKAQRLLGQIARRLKEKGNAAREAGNLTTAASFYERSLEIEDRQSVRKRLRMVRNRIQKQKRVERLLSEVRSTLNQESPSAGELKMAQRQVERVLTLDSGNQKASKLKKRIVKQTAQTQESEESGDPRSDTKEAAASANYDIEGLHRDPERAPLPRYTENEFARIRVRVTVDPEGRIVRRIPLRKGSPELEAAVMDALQQWRFNALPSGAPQKNQTGTITFTFREIPTREKTVPRKGLVAYYPFNGNLNDESGNNYDGYLKGNPKFVDGISGKCLSFDGSGDYIDTPAPISSDELTYSVWVKTKSDNSVNSFITGLEENGNISRLSYEPGNAGEWLGIRYGGNTMWDTDILPEINDNEWTHIVITVSNSYEPTTSSVLYIDGKAQGRPQKRVGGRIDPTDRLRIGVNANTRNNSLDYNGKIDEVRIYDRALSKSEVQNLYNDELQGRGSF